MNDSSAPLFRPVGLRRGVSVIDQRARSWLRLTILATGLWLLAGCQDPDAVTFVVDSTVDAPAATPGDGVCTSTAGGCTLRAAIQEANLHPHADTIVLSDGATYTLAIPGADDNHAATGDLDIRHALTITGDATIDANGLDRVFDVHSGRLTLVGPTLTGGAAVGGGAIRVGNAAELLGIGIEIHSNTAMVGGAAIHANTGGVNLLATAIVDNRGGVAGAIRTNGPLQIQHSTIAHNRADSIGGSGGILTSQPAAIRWSTIAHNSGVTGGLSGPAEITTTAIVENNGGDCAGAVISIGYNADSDGTCLTDTATGDQPGIAAALAPLSFHGGPTRVLPPIADSPLRNAVPEGIATCGEGVGSVDQHLASRPRASACDIGAHEAFDLADSTIVVNHGGDDVAADPTTGVCQDASGPPDACSLRAAIDVANLNPHINTIVVDPTVETITLSRPGRLEDDNATGDLDVRSGLTLLGNGATIDADRIDRVLHIHAGTSTIDDLTVTGGRTTSDDALGGGIRVDAPAELTLSEATIRDNFTVAVTGAGAGRGGGIHNAGILTIENSTIDGNAVVGSSAGGGGIYNGGTLTATNVTITANHAGSSGGNGLEQGGATATSSIRGSTIASNGLSTSTSPAVHLQDGSMTIAGSILHNPMTANCSGDITSGGYNLVSDSTCGATEAGDVQGASSNLAPLADNGGSSATFLPFADSAAVDAIPVGTPDLCDGSIATDQRGQPRPDGSACDIGSAEGSSPDPAPSLELTVTHGGDALAADPGNGTCQDASGPAGACSLRAALDVATTWLTGPATIVIDPDVDTITLNGVDLPTPTPFRFFEGNLVVVSDLVIVGNGTTLDANGVGRALDVRKGEVAIEAVTITGGLTSQDGAGVRILEPAQLTLTDSAVTGNAGTAAGNGGGIANLGTLTLVGSTTSDNVLSIAAASGGGIYSTGTLTVVNSTISNNAAGGASAEGGGILVAGGAANLTASTIADNTATTGAAGLHQRSGTVSVEGSAVSNLTGPDCAGSVVSGGYNVAGDSSCGFAATNDLQHVAVVLGPLGDNGGPTLSHLPAPWSPAADLIPEGTVGLCDGTIPTDQRGVVRPQGGTCTAGAVEVLPAVGPMAVVNHGGDDVAADPASGVCQDASGPAGACSLRAAIDVANALPGTTITIEPGVHPTLSLAGAGEGANATGDLDIHQTVTVAGNGAVIDAAGLDRVLTVHNGDVTLRDLTVTGGRLHGDGAQGAGIRLTGGRLTIEEVSVAGNEMTGRSTRGAGIHVSGGAQLVVLSSTIAHNRHAAFEGQGGGILVAGGTAFITNSTLSTNRSLYGAAIHRSSGSVTVNASTIANNNGLDIVHASGLTGVTVAGSVIAPGTIGFGACTFPLASGGYNVVFDTTCELTGPGDVQGIDPLLGPLAANGGPTDTHVAIEGSPVLDHIPVGTLGLCDGTLDTDQRGAPRPTGAGCDVGSVEHGPG
ncbi:MAG: CSLREA domain-containing protein [Acidimicrobiia bacterium]|nr:CSLREA domain-containing protein [Acidimicrobiia bacterium]